MKKKHGVFFGFAVLLITAIFTLAGCDHGGGSDDDEFDDEDFTVTAKVINSSANQAGLWFLATPDIKLFKDEIATAKANGFAWLTNNTDWPKIAGSSSAFFANGKQDQLSAQGSGFKLTLETNVGTTWEFRPGIGVTAMFTFTENNLGTDTYNALLGKLDDLESNEGWVVPTTSALAELGISVHGNFGNSHADENITDRISLFFMNMGNDGILFAYGAVLVDRAAMTNFAEEGVSLPVSDAEEYVWSDGTLDGKITAEWWIVVKQ